ncbi:hypothetical protein Btru_019931 [Bulinus truncatus]|nr:hypothetical protein Btru_019931 [Bulinus truncatus]
MLYYYFLLTVLLMCKVECRSNGTEVDKACTTLLPDHGVLPQNTMATYSITFYPTIFFPGENVTVQFFLPQRTSYRILVAGHCTRPQVLFVTLSNLQVITHFFFQNALVHSSNSDKTAVHNITWTAPNTSTGDVTFRATFVQAYNTFWENVNSSVLADGARLNLTTLNSTAASNTASTFNMYQSFNNCTCYWAHTSSCYNLTCLCVAGWTGDFCDVEVDECSQVPSPCGDNMTCVNTQGSYRCECGSGTRRNTGGQCEAIPETNCQYSYCTHTAIPAANCQYSYCTHTSIPAANCQYSGDIIMVLDSSGSIGSGNFQQLLSFVNSFFTSVLQSPNDIRFGLIEFDEVPIKRFDLKSYNTLPQYQTAILGMTYLGGSTQTGKALRLIIADQMFSEQAGGRVTAPDIVITITDGMSSNPNDTIEAAKSIKGSGVKALSVGITGNVDMTELNVLASRPEYVTLVNDFNSFYSALIPLLNNTCQAIKEAVEQHPGVCNGANFTNGEANLPFPGDCTKVIQCYYNPDSKTTLAVVRRCSPGQFWSPEKQDCASS